jgi:hypothetical protein
MGSYNGIEASQTNLDVDLFLDYLTYGKKTK